MSDNLRDILETGRVEASAPCRIDMGGTLDISTFYYPLRHLTPCTFNIAIALRTRVRLHPYTEGRIKVSSTGFESAEFAVDQAPFDHPLGLMFAIGAYYRAGGVHIDIESASPPRSALGGSSVAAVALIGAFSAVFDKMGVYRHLYRREIAILAHALEESVLGIPCGLQDQLAAAYGGVNAWQWHGRVKEGVFEKEAVVKKNHYARLEEHLLLAYCGMDHDSTDTNSRWIRQFVSGRFRNHWKEIIQCTQRFIDAMGERNYTEAAKEMNRETDLRREMTPDVLDDTGAALVKAARENGCGGRFTGAGGGGCLWAIGETQKIAGLRNQWQEVLGRRPDGRLLDIQIDSDGLKLPIL